MYVIVLILLCCVCVLGIGNNVCTYAQYSSNAVATVMVVADTQVLEFATN